MKRWIAFLLLLPTLSFAVIPSHWEKIKGPKRSLEVTYLYRMSVPHGWLVVTFPGHSTVFVPDENHEWVIEK